MQEIHLWTGRAKPEEPSGTTPFYGEVTTEALIDGNSLATAIGLTAGTTQNTTEPWLAFELDGTLLLVAKKTLRHSISWNQIQAVNAVYGSRSVDIHGSSYRIRLLKGATSDPIPAVNGYDLERSWGSEWNRLLYPLVPNPTNVPTHPVSREGIRYGEWANYTETQLNVGSSSGNGRYNWCQETIIGNSAERVFRGFAGVSYFSHYASSVAASFLGWRPVLELVRATPEPEDVFLGEVPVTKLITGTGLASQIGLTAGTTQHDDAGWLKYLTREGKTLYVAKKPYRHSVSWNHINALGAVSGTLTVTIADKRYKVRLLTGANSNPTSVAAGYNPVGTEQSEWNRLICPVHNGNHADTRNTTPPGYWPLYSDADLVVHGAGGNGNYSWCQETLTVNTARRVLRGGNVGLSNFGSGTSSAASSIFGWRPVLELVG